jgi:hypothetical protein
VLLGWTTNCSKTRPLTGIVAGFKYLTRFFLAALVATLGPLPLAEIVYWAASGGQ